MNEIPEVVVEVNQVISDAIDRWKSVSLTPESVSKFVDENLNARRREILLKLMGFNIDRYPGSRWELDHCNGRSGQSLASDLLKTYVSSAVEKWIGDQGLRKLPEMPKDIADSLISEFNKTFSAAIKKELESLAFGYARVVAKNMFEEKTGIDPTRLSGI